VEVGLLVRSSCSLRMGVSFS